MSKVNIVVTSLILLLLTMACKSATETDFEYPYTKTFDFNPLIYSMEDKLTVTGSRAHVTFDIPEITSEVVSGGDVTIRLYDDGRWYDLPTEVRHTIEGNPYYEGYIDYTYNEGRLKIINGTTSRERMSSNYFKGGPYEVTITD